MSVCVGGKVAEHKAMSKPGSSILPWFLSDPLLRIALTSLSDRMGPQSIS